MGSAESGVHATQVKLPPHSVVLSQVPQLSGVPQPSSGAPHVAPSVPQVVGTHSQVNVALHVAGEVQPPQSSVPPQPSAGPPHVAPSAAHEVGVQPHRFAVPPPPQVSGSMHMGQVMTPAHPSGISPQSPAMHVRGVQGPTPQRFGIPIAPHTRSGRHMPQSMVPPQPSVMGPHSAPSASHVVGTHGPESRRPAPASRVGTSPSAPTRDAPPRSSVQDQARRHALTTSLLMS